MARLSLKAAPLLAAIALVISGAEAFAPTPRASISSCRGPVVATRSVVLREGEGDEDVGLPPLPSQKNAPPKEVEVAPPQPVASTPVVASSSGSVEEEQGTSYPINLPSPILLASSMVLAISSTGALFEVTGPGPYTLGFGPEAALAALGLPLSIFLIYAAILKGAAETEEDDKEYNKPRKL